MTRLQNAAGCCEDERAELSLPLDEYHPLDVNIVAVCLDAGQDGSCDSCPERDIEAEILEVYAAQQDSRMCPEDPKARAIHELELGCVARVRIEGQQQCCYNAAIVSECNVSPGQSD